MLCVEQALLLLLLLLLYGFCRWCIWAPAKCRRRLALRHTCSGTAPSGTRSDGAGLNIIYTFVERTFLRSPNVIRIIYIYSSTRRVIIKLIIQIYARRVYYDIYIYTYFWLPTRFDVGVRSHPTTTLPHQNWRRHEFL